MAIDWDRIGTVATGELREGEQLRVVFPALTPRDDGGRGLLPASLLLLVVLVDRWQWSRAARRTTTESLFPVAPRMFVGLTDRRLLVWNATRRWSPRQFIGFVPLAGVVRAEAVTVGAGWRTLRIDLASEPSVRIRVPGRLADELAAALSGREAPPG